MSNKIIYQITTRPLPIDEFIMVNDFIDHWIFGTISDSVNNNIDRNEEIQRFREWLEKLQAADFNNKGDVFVIPPGGKETYFMRAFSNFKETIKKAADITFEDFVGISDCFLLIYQMNNSYCDKNGTYVSSDEFGTIPFDEFMRDAETGKKYYINGIVYYHS